MKRMTVHFDFDELTEDGYTYHDLSKIFVDGEFDQKELSAIAEGWSQSDFYWVGISNALINAIGEGSTDDFKY